MPSTTKIDKIIAQIEATTRSEDIKELARELSILVARELQQYKILLQKTRDDNTVAITDSYISLDDQLIALRNEVAILKEWHVNNRQAIDGIVTKIEEISIAIATLIKANGDNAGSKATQ